MGSADLIHDKIVCERRRQKLSRKATSFLRNQASFERSLKRMKPLSVTKIDLINACTTPEEILSLGADVILRSPSRYRKKLVEIFGAHGFKPKDKKENKKALVQKKLAAPDGAFDYSTARWRTLRYKVLSSSGGKCVLCGSTDKLHVDHIKPVSLYPDLAHDIDNLQVLCADCNLGKSNFDTIDWRNRDQKSE